MTMEIGKGFGKGKEAINDNLIWEIKENRRKWRRRGTNMHARELEENERKRKKEKGKEDTRKQW